MVYLVFKGDDYYPGGGWDDFVLRTDDYDLAVKVAGALENYCWSHIVDLTTNEVTAYFHKSPGPVGLRIVDETAP